MRTETSTQCNEVMNAPTETIEVREYDDRSGFWIIVTGTHSEATKEIEKKILELLTKSYIERKCDHQ